MTSLNESESCLPKVHSLAATAKTNVTLCTPWSLCLCIGMLLGLPAVIVLLRRQQSVRLAGICLFSEFGAEGMSNEGQRNLEEYAQLLEDMKQRCAMLQHELQDYTDAVVHRCNIIVFCHLSSTMSACAQHACLGRLPCSIACNSSTHHTDPLQVDYHNTARLALHNLSSSQAGKRSEYLNDFYYRHNDCCHEELFANFTLAGEVLLKASQRGVFVAVINFLDINCWRQLKIYVCCPA